jgi:DNA repair exonuclease SbcCD ATPase subunit
MTALIQLLPSKAASPQEQASRIFGLIKKLEGAAKKADLKVSEIESRGWLKNIVASSRDDLVSTARSQGEINELMVQLNQEIIGLNTLGFAYLTSVIAEFERQVNEGVKDSDGRIHVLSENGRNVAKAAKEMFGAILDTSRETQGRIDANAEAAVGLRLDVDTLSGSFSAYSSLVDVLQKESADLHAATGRLDSALALHESSLENIGRRFEEAACQAAEQAANNSRALQNLDDRLGGVSEIATSINKRTRAVEDLTSNLKVRIAEQSALVENHSTKINEAIDSISTLVDKGSELEKQLPSLLAQIDRLRDDHAAEKARLQRTTRAMSIAMLFLASICTALVLRVLHVM